VHGRMPRTRDRSVLGDCLGTGNGGLDELGRRHLSCLQDFDEADSVKVAKGVIAKGMNATHMQ